MVLDPEPNRPLCHRTARERCYLNYLYRLTLNPLRCEAACAIARLFVGPYLARIKEREW